MRGRRSRTKRDTPSCPPSGKSRRHLIVLLVVLLVAGAVRVFMLPQAPPGLNQDEAANAWNAWCLLKTGRDQAGVSWPIFYIRALGENRSALYLYTMLPFQALGGLNIWTTRLPSVANGLLTILLLYWIAGRLFNRSIALVAAGLLALNPWHIQLTRMGFEASLAPLLAGIPLAALLWARFPLKEPDSKPVIWRALIAGLAVGFSCYGYAAVRLFVPVFLVLCVVVTIPAWWGLLRQRRGALTVAALLVGAAASFGPLVYQHVAQAELIARRSKGLWTWRETDPVGVRLGKVATRYALHFGPEFLFMEGDLYEMQSPRGFGQYHWYALPLMLIGLIVALRNVRRSWAARILLCWILLYPAADCLHHHSARAPDGSVRISAHALRSLPGLCAPLLLSAVGAAAAFEWLKRRGRYATAGAVLGLAALTLALNIRFFHYFFGEYTCRPIVRENYHVDLMEAYAWLRPQADSADAVFVTTDRMKAPFILMLVALDYDPQQWFRDVRDVETRGVWDFYHRVGKFYFVYRWHAPTNQALNALKQNNRPDHVVFIVRPDAVNWPDPAHTVFGPDGQATLRVYVTDL